jgi:agmatine deiminase
MRGESGMKISNRLRMPAEWERHEATWLVWPHNEDHWPGNFSPIPYVYVEIVRAIKRSEKVFICVNDVAMEQHARVLLQPDDAIRFFHIPTNASWSRDHGPIFVKDEEGQLLITDWIFHSWGEKYPPWDLDDVVPQRVGEILNIPLIAPGIVLEGGSIDVNGKGTLLTTEQCLLNRNRNPQLNRAEIEQYLEKYLGAANVLWLKEGIIGDDTDGHIDDIARFVNKRTVVCVIEQNRSDENYEILKRNHDDLQKMRDQDGHLLEIAELPMPDPVFYEKNRLPASYANFYITNGTVLVPTFRCAQDHTAIDIFEKLFPDREIVGIDCVDLVWGLGTIHCSTQQQPAV